LVNSTIPSGGNFIAFLFVFKKNNYFYVDQQEEDDGKSRITVSKQFKDKVVKPILKVK
jgi:hypothetical protein